MAVENHHAPVAIVQQRTEQFGQHGDMDMDIDGQCRAEGQMMMACPEPERRQQENTVRLALLHAFRDGRDEQRVRDGRQMPAVLLARRDRGDDNRLVSVHFPQERPGEFGEAHECLRAVVRWILRWYSDNWRRRSDYQATRLPDTRRPGHQPPGHPMKIVKY